MRPAQSHGAGSNENTKGPLRRYRPKGTDQAVYTADDLARTLNGRPRETLEFMTPSGKLAEFIALTG
jgi:IS30 family transposase